MHIAKANPNVNCTLCSNYVSLEFHHFCSAAIEIFIMVGTIRIWRQEVEGDFVSSAKPCHQLKTTPQNSLFSKISQCRSYIYYAVGFKAYKNSTSMGKSRG